MLVFVAAAFPFVVLLQLATGLYQGNRELLSANEVPWIWLVTCLILAWIATASAIQLAKSIRQYLWGVVAGYAFFLLVRESVFPPELGTLDGGNPFEAVTPGYQVWELLTLLLFMIATAWVPPWISMRIASVFVFSFLAVFLLDGARTWRQAAPSGDAMPGGSRSLAAADSRLKPDIFHLMYDTYQTVEHQFTTRGSGSVTPYDDFVFFPNNLANYNFTELVIPASFSGTLYTPGKEIADWKRASNSGGLLQNLKKAGYHIQAHSYHPYYFTSPLCDLERHTVDVMADVESKAGIVPHVGFLRSSFFELMVLRCLPTAGSNVVWARRNERLAVNHGLPPRTASAYYCAIKFREVLEQVKSTPAGGHYYFLHLIIPHSPFVLDRDGNYLGGDVGTHYNQSLFADRLTTELIKQLKRLGRYDDSLIMIQADTGEYFQPDVNQQHLEKGELTSYVTPRWKDGEMLYADEVDGRQSTVWPVENRADARLCPEEIVRARAQSLLLIKPPHHRGYEINPGRSQSVDIGPTILGASGVQYDPADFPLGIDLLKGPVPADRVRRTYVFGALRRGKRTGGMQEWEVDGDRFKKLESVTVKDTRDEYRFR